MSQEYIRNIRVTEKVGPLLNPVLFDNFEDRLKWVKSGTGSDYICEIDETNLSSGFYALRMKTKETTPAIDDYVQTEIWLPTRNHKRVLYKATIICPVNERKVWAEIRLNVKKDYYNHIAAMRFHWLDDKIAYQKSDGSWEILENQFVMGDVSQRMEIEMVINLDRKEYEYIRVNHKQIALPTVGYQYGIGAQYSSKLIAYLKIINTEATRGELFWDDVLIEFSD